MTEVQFLNALVDRVDCRLLCDVSNVWVSAHNLGFDPYAYLDALPGHAIDEWHLGGFTREDDDATPESDVLIDTHACRVADSAWALYAYAIGALGTHPTLIEWDTDIPPLSTLLAEASHADAVAACAPQRGAHHATR